MVRSTLIYLARGAGKAQNQVVEKKVSIFQMTLLTFGIFLQFSNELFLSMWINRKNTYMKISIRIIIWVEDQSGIIKHLFRANSKKSDCRDFEKKWFWSSRLISMGSGLHFCCLRRAAAQKQWLIHGAKHSPPSLWSGASQGPKLKFQHFVWHWKLLSYFLMSFS